MAKRVITTTEFTDDIDGAKAEGTVTFSFDGRHYEIDLSKKNRAAFEKALKPYTEAGRKTRSAGRGAARSSSRTSRGAGARRSASRSDLSAIREWARANGHQVAERGRITQEIQDAYDAAS